MRDYYQTKSDLKNFIDSLNKQFNESLLDPYYQCIIHGHSLSSRYKLMPGFKKLHPNDFEAPLFKENSKTKTDWSDVVVNNFSDPNDEPYTFNKETK